MDEPRLLTNSQRTDRLLRSKLAILKKTLRVRGVEVTIIKPNNEVFDKVHGFNTIELLGGDRADEVKISKARLVLNLNNLERVGEKASQAQTCYHYEDILDEGDIILYDSLIYEYAFKVDQKNVYGEQDFLYEYELTHFRTIKIQQRPADTKPKSTTIVNVDEGGNIITEQSEMDAKDIDQVFVDHNADYKEGKLNDPKLDWRNRIDELDL